MYDDLAKIPDIYLPESRRIQSITIATVVTIKPSSGTAETAELTCYVDDVTITEE